MTGYTHSVLITTTSGVDHDPFGSSTTPSSASIPTISSSATASVSTYTSSASATATASPVPNSLGGGAIAGIAIGGTAAVIMLLAAIWFIFRRRQAKKMPRQSTSTYHSAAPPYSGQEHMAYYPKPDQGYYSPPISPPLFHSEPQFQHECFDSTIRVWTPLLPRERRPEFEFDSRHSVRKTHRAHSGREPCRTGSVPAELSSHDHAHSPT